MVSIPGKSSNTLLGIIENQILPGTTIFSDCWRDYDCLASQGYQYLRVNKSINFIDPATGAQTKHRETLA
jgi:hypothetical protein